VVPAARPKVRLGYGRLIGWIHSRGLHLPGTDGSSYAPTICSRRQVSHRAGIVLVGAFDADVSQGAETVARGSAFVPPEPI
jgi:hypothetical protein